MLQKSTLADKQGPKTDLLSLEWEITSSSEKVCINDSKTKHPTIPLSKLFLKTFPDVFLKLQMCFFRIFFVQSQLFQKAGKISNGIAKDFFVSNLLHLWIQSPIILKLGQLIVHSCGHFRSVGVLLMSSVMILVGIVGSVLPIVIVPF